MDSLIFSLNAVLPIILLSALGFYLRKNGTLSDEFLKNGNRFCFNYGFMAMMFINVYKIESFKEIKWNVVIFALAINMIFFAIGFFYVKYFIKDDRQKGVVHQAFYRSNYATIGLPLAFNILGEKALVTATLLSAFSVPLYNILAVISLTVFQKENNQKKSFFFLLRKIITNPLIIGVVLGLLCVFLRSFVGEYRISKGNLRFLYNTVDEVAQIAPWLSLIILGGQFKFSDVKRLFSQISVSVIARLILAPVIGMIIVIFVPQLIGMNDFANYEKASLFALFAAPEAVASVSMADQMNGDSVLAGQILVWTAVFSAFTLFIFVAFFRFVNIF